MIMERSIAFTTTAGFPKTTPFVSTAGANPTIWTWVIAIRKDGLRRSHRSHLAAEHGPKGGDELNHLEEG